MISRYKQDDNTLHCGAERALLAVSYYLSSSCFSSSMSRRRRRPTPLVPAAAALQQDRPTRKSGIYMQGINMFVDKTSQQCNNGHRNNKRTGNQWSQQGAPPHLAACPCCWLSASCAAAAPARSDSHVRACRSGRPLRRRGRSWRCGRRWWCCCRSRRDHLRLRRGGVAPSISPSGAFLFST